ncbi:Lrp/AsnC family transcriptional regulator [Candidatus Micrarchaeota archaeon]|nr:Lrp/AsnC family transcriptional regulator [Candidatus Micrarchaeota archaeon]
MLDAMDRRIISELCHHSKGSYRKLAKKIGIHTSTLISRITRLEKLGIIKGYTAKIDYEKVGYSFLAIVELLIPKKLIEIQNKLKSLSGVFGVYDVTGEADSLLFIACENTREFNSIIKKIHEIPGVERTNTHVILNIIKDWSDFTPV